MNILRFFVSDKLMILKSLQKHIYFTASTRNQSKSA